MFPLKALEEHPSWPLLPSGGSRQPSVCRCITPIAASAFVHALLPSVPGSFLLFTKGHWTQVHPKLTMISSPDPELIPSTGQQQLSTTMLMLLLLLLRHFSRVRLCATPSTAAHQGFSLGFSRQEHWSGLPFPSLSKFIFQTPFLTYIVLHLKSSRPTSNLRKIFLCIVTEWFAYINSFLCAFYI